MMMSKTWVKRAAYLGMMGVLAGSAYMTVLAQDTQQKDNLYIFNTDFPPQKFVDYPKPSVRETHFWQMLDREMRESEKYGLTENLEDADYRVTLRCAGIRYCSKLKVTIQTPQRDVLGTYSISARPRHSRDMQLDSVAIQLANTLEERIEAIKRGEVGNYGYIPPSSTSKRAATQIRTSKTSMPSTQPTTPPYQTGYP